MQTMARAPSATGPFEPCPHNPLITHRSRPTRVHAVGHADIVRGPDGDWFGVCHGIRPKGSYSFQVLGRETFAFPVNWAEDGWPNFGEGGMLPEQSITAPPETAFVDDFTQEARPLPWNHLRNPDTDRYQRGDGRLVVEGAPDAITSRGRPAWLGIRQRDHNCRFEADVRFAFDGAGESGLTAFQNREYHLCIGVRRAEDGMTGFTRVRLGELTWEDAWEFGEDVRSLFIEASDRRYHLGVRGPDGRRCLASYEARLLSREFGGRFTGVYLALYAEEGARLSCTECRYNPE
jgi:alpha-N-arabinofuranosidase